MFFCIITKMLYYNNVRFHYLMEITLSKWKFSIILYAYKRIVDLSYSHANLKNLLILLVSQKVSRLNTKSAGFADSIPDKTDCGSADRVKTNRIRRARVSPDQTRINSDHTYCGYQWEPTETIKRFVKKKKK